MASIKFFFEWSYGSEETKTYKSYSFTVINKTDDEIRDLIKVVDETILAEDYEDGSYAAFRDDMESDHGVHDSYGSPDENEYEFGFSSYEVKDIDLVFNSWREFLSNLFKVEISQTKIETFDEDGVLISTEYM